MNICTDRSKSSFFTFWNPQGSEIIYIKSEDTDQNAGINRHISSCPVCTCQNLRFHVMPVNVAWFNQLAALSTAPDQLNKMVN